MKDIIRNINYRFLPLHMLYKLMCLFINTKKKKSRIKKYIMLLIWQLAPININ